MYANVQQSDGKRLMVRVVSIKLIGTNRQSGIIMIIKNPENKNPYFPATVRLFQRGFISIDKQSMLLVVSRWFASRQRSLGNRNGEPRRAIKTRINAPKEPERGLTMRKSQIKRRMRARARRAFRSCSRVDFRVDGILSATESRQRGLAALTPSALRPPTLPSRVPSDECSFEGGTATSSTIYINVLHTRSHVSTAIKKE